MWHYYRPYSENLLAAKEKLVPAQCIKLEKERSNFQPQAQSAQRKAASFLPRTPPVTPAVPPLSPQKKPTSERRWGLGSEEKQMSER
jgi:hypothetical protein